MSDMKNTYEQRRWEYYAGTHARAINAFEKFSHLRESSRQSVQKFLSGIMDNKIRAEQEYPCLKEN